MKREEVEVCPHCDREITLYWNVEHDGYQIACPHCGEKIMLCDACRHSDDNPNMICDWSEEYGCFRKQPSLLREIRAELDAIYSREGGHSYEEVIEEVVRTHKGVITERTHDWLLQEGMPDNLLYLLPNVPMSAFFKKGREECMITVSSKNKVVAITTKFQLCIVPMTSTDIATYLLNSSKTTIEFAINKNPTTGEPETWFFAKIIKIPQYSSNFLLIDYCGGLEATAYPISEDVSEEKVEVEKAFARWMNTDCEDKHGEGPDMNDKGQYIVYVDVNNIKLEQKEVE